MSDISEPKVLAARVRPHPGEGIRQVNPGSLGQHALGLLDHDPAVQRDAQLRVQQQRLLAGAMLHNAQRGQVGEGAGDDQVGLFHRGLAGAQQVQGAQSRVAQPQRDGERGGESGLNGCLGKGRPAASAGLENLVTDWLASAEGIQAGPFPGLQLKQLKQPHRLAGGRYESQVARWRGEHDAGR